MQFRKLMAALSVVILLAFSAVAHAQSDSPQPKSADVGTALGDAAITAKVKAKYLDDKRLKNTDISVTTANGVVSLTGTVPTSEAKDAAEELARSVDGVLNVSNDIEAPTVASKIEKKTKRAAKKTERVVSDSWITTKVKSALLADSATKGFKISVKTVNHVVALTGTVDSQASIDHADDLAKKVEGVTEVDTTGLVVGSK
jgi:hyperosmotically inducible protein